MRSSGFRSAFVVAAVAGMLLVPSLAMANGWAFDRSLLAGMWVDTYWAQPDVSGHWAVYLQRSGTDVFQLKRVDLRSGADETVATEVLDGIDSPAVDGDWVAYTYNTDIYVRNLATGTLKKATNDGATINDVFPTLSGSRVVWEQFTGAGRDIYGKEFNSTHAKFLIAGGPGDQDTASIRGSRVAYVDHITGPDAGQIMVKTIGSSAAAVNLTNNNVDQDKPSIGDHLVAWLVKNGSGKWMIRYHNFDTGQTLDGPSSASYDIDNPQVAGDRITYEISNGTDLDVYVFDVRVSRQSGSPVSFPLRDVTDFDQQDAKIAGNSLVFLSRGFPYWGKLAAPSVSIGSVPTRVPRHGHIHLKGTLSDQGVPIAGRPVRVEK